MEGSAGGEVGKEEGSRCRQEARRPGGGQEARGHPPLARLSLAPPRPLLPCRLHTCRCSSSSWLIVAAPPHSGGSAPDRPLRGSAATRRLGIDALVPQVAGRLPVNWLPPRRLQKGQAGRAEGRGGGEWRRGREQRVRGAA